MQEPRAQRTLVKSPPELWAEVSDIDALARHLGEFGEIRITRLDPETTVAWEGDRACGTVALEPSGWGTKVTLTAKLAEEVAAEPVAAEPEPKPAEPEPVAVEPEPEPVAVEPEPRTADPEPLGAEPEPDAPEPLATGPEPDAVAPEPLAAEPDPDAVAPEHDAPPAEAPKVGFFARLFGRGRKVAPVVEVEPQPEAEPVAGEQLAAEPVAVEPEPFAVEPEPVAFDPEPVAFDPAPVAFDPAPVAVEPEPVAVEPEPVAVEPEPVAADPLPAPLDAERAQAILTGVLDDLGSAHHRPFSRT
jgi:hypothetical protein